VGNLTRNVNEEHLREIFGQWGKLLRVELGWDRRIDQPKGFAYVEYDKYADSVEALKRMDGVRHSYHQHRRPQHNLLIGLLTCVVCVVCVVCVCRASGPN
jgi:RNA recognition motif-containing protein